MENENELAWVQGSCLCGSGRFELLGKTNGFFSATACAVGVPPGLPMLQIFLRIRRTSVGFPERNRSNVTNWPKSKGLRNNS